MMDSYQHDASPISLLLSVLFVGLFLVLWTAVLIVSVIMIAEG